MGIYTERKIGIWPCAALLAGVFVVMYGVWLFVGPELMRHEVVYAAAAEEVAWKSPLVMRIHGWSTPECMPLFPAAARFLRALTGAPMESVLRGLSLVMLAAGAVLVYLAAGSRHSPRAGAVAAAMYSSCFLALGTAVEGTPATVNAFFLAAAQLIFFYYGIRRSDWNRAWIFSALLATLGFLSGGITVLWFFIFPMFFFRRPLSVSSKFRRPGFAAAVVIVVLTALAWGGVFTSSPRQISLYDMWWRQLSEVSLGWRLLTFPFGVVFWLLPWSLIAWMPFCVALQSMDKTPIYSRYLRTLAFSSLVLLWLLPEADRFGLFYALAPLSVLTGRFYEAGARRYGVKLRKCFVVVEIFMAAVPVVFAAGCLIPETWLPKFISVESTLAFRDSIGFAFAAAAVTAAAVLLALYVRRRRNDDPVWLVLLAVSVAASLFFNGLIFSYKSQDRSKRKFGYDVHRLMGSSGRVLYTQNVRNLTGGLFYAKVPVWRLGPAEDPPDGEDEIYLLSGEKLYPPFAGYNWENLFPEEYSYNGHPLKLWKGRPSRTYTAPPTAPDNGRDMRKDTQPNREKNQL